MTETINPHEFWPWAFSDFLSNALRGVLAEYIVAQAADCTHTPRREWDAYDLKTKRGLKIEVKSAAYLQTWEQRRHSPIRFDIGKKRGWDAETNLNAAEPTRTADLYVFCVFSNQERKTANPLDLAQWFFLVCPTPLLDIHFGAQKSVALSALIKLGLKRLDFTELKEKMDEYQSSGALL